MARSLRVSPQYICQVKQAVKRNGFPSQNAFAKEFGGSPSESTVKKFLRGENVDYSFFLEIADKLGLDWQKISQANDQNPSVTIPNNFFAYDTSWVGRDKLTTELSQKLRNSCRFLLILGLTGIGKTALAEKLALELQDLIEADWNNKLLRYNFDYEGKSTDFTSVAAGWLESLGENIPSADKKPELLLNRLVRCLQDNQLLVLIDSMERLLSENEDGGWGDFTDKYWEKFFLRLLSAESCRSRLIVTSQDLPVELHSKASRYDKFYQRHILYGLEEPEQEELFEIEGLNITQESEDRPILLRLGKAYKGHPLVLRVIIGEINSNPFNGDVQNYWNYQDIESEKYIKETIEEVEKDIAEAEAGKTQGYDEWELHKLTTDVYNKVNKARLESVFNRLETQLRDAYILICAASVYRIPVQKEGWSMQLAALVKRVEKGNCSDERQKKALKELLNRFLAEKSFNHNGKLLLGQHNLVRSVALEKHKKLIQDLKSGGSQ
ncbi:ATP-binding protein [Moorena sp. SIO4A5]|uniref:ATP-binding protein n=1 Tax=Moorena sp. SIO4A5 TaxID=2607838 RepID=UPI0013CB243D|nr:ATP-binding protein [Moorena sp. SIO4A5]NEO25058.1 ATP-binding protein [Moorena sp. SIO4A5]